MNKQKNEIKDEIILELSFKLQMKDYKLKFATRRAWLIGVVIIAIRLILIFVDESA